MSLLLLLLSCPAPDAPCGPEGRSEAWCPIDECAADCTSVEEGAACCLDEHGMGLEGMALERLLDACSGEACDPSRYISEAAALCIAQVNGLGSGVGFCGAGLWYNSELDVRWMVVNTTWDGCLVGIPEVEGDLIAVDARSGASSGTLSTLNGTLDECPTE